MVLSRFCKSTMLLIAQVAWTKCDKRVSVAEHLHNVSPFSLHDMIEVSAEAWHAILYLVTPWQYLPRLGIRQGLECYSISCHALAVSAEAWHAILYLVTSWQYLPRLDMLFYILLQVTPWQYLRSSACCSMSCHALAVSAEAWHAIIVFHILSQSRTLTLAESHFLYRDWRKSQLDE